LTTHKTADEILASLAACQQITGSGRQRGEGRLSPRPSRRGRGGSWSVGPAKPALRRASCGGDERGQHQRGARRARGPGSGVRRSAVPERLCAQAAGRQPGGAILQAASRPADRVAGGDPADRHPIPPRGQGLRGGQWHPDPGRAPAGPFPVGPSSTMSGRISNAPSGRAGSGWWRSWPSRSSSGCSLRPSATGSGAGVWFDWQRPRAVPSALRSSSASTSPTYEGTRVGIEVPRHRRDARGHAPSSTRMLCGTASNRSSPFESVPCECGDGVDPGQFVRVADGVHAGDPTVLDGEAQGGVDLTAAVEADGGRPVEPGRPRLEVR
jgi:hypothetical protein